MSGGRATLARRKGVQASKQSGDITSTHPLGHSLTDHWFIECKHVASLNLESGMMSGIGKLATFWRTACREALEHKLMPMIIGKQNRTDILLVVPRGALLNPSGLSPFPYGAKIATFKILECDLFLFDKVLLKPFPKAKIAPDYRWLKEGELARILAQPHKPTMAPEKKSKGLARSSKRKSK